MMLTFSNGSKGPQTVLISTTSDNAVEVTETFTVSLTTNETTVTIVPTSAVAAVNIQDNSSEFQWTGLKHRTDQETDRKTDRDKLEFQGLEQNLHQLCHVASKIIFCCGW